MSHQVGRKARLNAALQRCWKRVTETGSYWTREGSENRIQIGTLRPIRVDHTKCLQVAIKTHSFIPSGQDVSEFLDILGLVKSYFSSFFGEKK